MREIIIKTEHLQYTYPDGTVALHDVSLEIERGKKIALLGANGSGKSTFFLCLNGINRPQSGKLYFDGAPYDYSKQGLLNLRSKVGIVFQDPDNQLFSASVYQEISFGAMNLGLPADTVKERVEDAIDTLEITPFRKKPTHFLSGGQKKQVAVADIVVTHPEVIILDEPGAALDPKHTKTVNRLIDRLNHSGMTTIISTHDVNHAYAWADHVILFHNGTVLLQGKPEDVFSDEDALEKTNLEKPAALRMFDTLCKNKLLPATLPLPRTLDAVEQYLRQYTTGKESEL